MIANTHLIHNSLQQTQSFKEFPNAGTGICITKQQHAFEGIKHLCRNKGKLPNGPHHQTFLEVLLPTLDAMKVNHSAPPAHTYKIDCNHRTADGNPEPEIKWIKDGKTVATQGLLTFEAMRNQSGKYLCSVENGLNSTVNASATLDVQCK